MEKLYNKGDDVMCQKTLYNGNSYKCAANCCLHKCGLTVKQIKQRKCLSKNCRHFKKYEEHSYWKQRAYVSRMRKERKLKLMSYNMDSEKLTA